MSSRAKFDALAKYDPLLIPLSDEMPDLADELAGIFAEGYGGAAAATAAIRGTTAALGNVTSRAAAYGRTRGGSLMKGVDGTTQSRMQDILGGAIEDGTDPTSSLASLFGDSHAQTVARTETTTAYNAGTISALKDAGEKYAYVSDPCTCGEDVCDVDGQIWTLEECDMQLLGHPNAVMAGTRVLSLGAVRAAYRARWNGPLTRLRTAGGRLLAVGPNHPVLTRRGWVPAKLLRVGDHVVARRSADALGLPAQAQADHADPVVEQVFDALAANALSSRCTAAPAHFHGDGNFCEGDVEVVRPTRLLKRVGHAAFVEQARHLAVPFTAVEHEALASLGAGVLDAPTVALAAAGGMRHAHVPRVALTGPDRDAPLLQPLAEGAVADARFCREVNRRFPVEVELDEVVEVGDVASYVGHAFDLSTESVTYFANGILTHNCGRDFRPLTDEELQQVREEGDDDSDAPDAGDFRALDRLAYAEAFIEHAFDFDESEARDEQWFYAEDRRC